MMTMMVMNRSIGGHNRTHQDSERDNRKQNATNLHEEPPETSAERLVSLSSLLAEHRFGRESFPQCLTGVPNSATPPEPRPSSP
jgi:hypothetical protein